jgi:hypothetical protein
MGKDIKREAFTSEEMDKARKMWKEGKTYTEIGVALGRTNNSISGMMSRNRDKFPERYGDLMKKNKSARTLPRLEERKADTMAKLSSNNLRQVFHEALNPPASPPKPKEEALAYDQSRLPYAVTFMDLDERRCCKWPLTGFEKGRPNLFCGEVKSGRNYCANHQERQWRVQ